MNILKFTRVTICIWLICFFSCANAKNLISNEDISFNANINNYNVKLQIFDKKNNVANFLVAIADSETKRETGLMNLKKLENKYGMLFVFNNYLPIKMWMKNTIIPLDIIFIKNDEIVHIAENATPYSLETISSKFLCDKVLEINAGLVFKLKIKIGSKISLENKFLEK